MDFPHVDPLPIPAPVWLMKALGLLTLSLHFMAVQILIGSLLSVIYLSYKGRRSKNEAYLTATNVVARRLPIVMTYVVNFGVPPLLFAQVLYGRALYTSSVLVAGMWISVILLLMGCYWHLYRVAERAKDGKSVVVPALIALMLAAGVGQIYSINMTLMLRPEIWKEMYARTASGLQAPPHDPTMMPRWLFVMVGGLIVGGLWIALQSGLKEISPETKSLLKRFGTTLAIVGSLLQLGAGYMVHSTQPEFVQQGLQAPLFTGSAAAWAVGLTLVVFASTMMKAKTDGVGLAVLGGIGAFVAVAGSVIYRDGIRDTTLASKHFDVWQRTEYSNWGVIGLFLLLFVIGLGTIAWLLMVMKQAAPVNERVTL